MSALAQLLNTLDPDGSQPLYQQLQRALREAGTTYRAELDAFRIRRAHELLRQDERSLSWIAHELGFSSAQHFATAFRRAMGETPSVWRMRHRASA